jgi:hypothetical protein
VQKSSKSFIMSLSSSVLGWFGSQPYITLEDVFVN